MIAKSVRNVILIAAVALLPALAVGDRAHAQQPDLVVDEILVASPVEAGQQVAIQVRVRNSGLAVAPGSSSTTVGYMVDLVLSRDQFVPPGGANFSVNFREDALLVGGRISNTPELQPGQSEVVMEGTQVIPADTPRGSIFLCARIDPFNAVGEANEDNNVACQQITVIVRGAPSVACGNKSLGSTLLTPPLTTPNPVAGLGKTIVGTGSSLTIFRTDTFFFETPFSPGTGGVFQGPPITIRTNPADPDKWATFATNSDGSVYRFDPGTKTTSGLINVRSRDLRRPGCPADKLTAPAVVHERNSSNTTQAFKNRFATDVVYVGTDWVESSPACPGGQNRVYALDAETLSTLWVYNQTGSQVIESIIGAPYLDVRTDTLYVTSRGQGSANTLFALSVRSTLNTGAARWASSAPGSTTIGPFAFNNSSDPIVRSRIYVISDDGYMRAFDKLTGTVVGNAAFVQNGASNAIAISAANSPFDNRIVVLAFDGTIRRFTDGLVEEGTGVVADPTFAVKYVSGPFFDPTSDSIYFGRSDGKLQQISSSWTQQELQAVSPNSLSNVTGAAFIEEAASDGGSRLRLIATSSDGWIAKLGLPWCTAGAGG